NSDVMGLPAAVHSDHPRVAIPSPDLAHPETEGPDAFDLPKEVAHSRASRDDLIGVNREDMGWIAIQRPVEQSLMKLTFILPPCRSFVLLDLHTIPETLKELKAAIVRAIILNPNLVAVCEEMRDRDVEIAVHLILDVHRCD